MKIFLALMLCGCFAMAQPAAVKKIAQQASTESLKKNLYYLASNEMQGRLIASRGDTLASLLVAKKFRDNKLTAPYNNGSSYFQDVKATRIKDQNLLTINGKTVADADGWNLYPNVPVSVSTVPVFYNDFTTITEWDKNLPGIDVNGKAVILHQKLFDDDKR